MPAKSLHSFVRSSAPAAVVTTRRSSALTVIVCTNWKLVLPQPSVKFHVRTCVYAFGHGGFGVVWSETRWIVGLAVQLSVAAGARASAAAMPAESLHSFVRSSAPAAVVTTGAVVSITVMVW